MSQLPLQTTSNLMSRYLPRTTLSRLLHSMSHSTSHRLLQTHLRPLQTTPRRLSHSKMPHLRPLQTTPRRLLHSKMPRLRPPRAACI